MTTAEPVRRRNITIPPQWDAAISEQAESDGLTFSRWLLEAAAGRVHLDQSVLWRLAEPRGRGKPPAE